MRDGSGERSDATGDVIAALRSTPNPRTGEDVMASGTVRELQVDERGRVELDLALDPEDPAELAGTVRDAAAGVEGVTSVRVRVTTTPPDGGRRGASGGESGAAGEESAGEESGGGGTARAGGGASEPSPPGPSASRGRALPILEGGPGRGGGGRPGSGGPPGRSGGPAGGPGGGPPPGAGPRRPDDDREAASRHPSEAPALEGVRHVVAVSSGKGGVGKSTVATNLAAAWARSGHRVGLMDADIYGPDIPTMFGVHGKPRMAEQRVIPMEAHGVKLISIGFLIDEDTPAIWRGPIVMGIVRQFLQQVDWGELDYLVVDLPPGTGDAQLSLCQLVRVSGAVMVTTPQDVAVGGVLKGIRMFEKVEVPVLGIVENMRGFACPECGASHDIFGSGGGEKLAAVLDVPFLGAVPLGMAIREEGDRGIPTVVGRPDSAEARALSSVAKAAGERLGALEEAGAASSG